MAEVIEEGETLGIAMDRTLGPLTEQLGSLAPCSVVQLTGAFSSTSIRENPGELIRRTPNVNGSAYTIFAPLFVPQADTAAEVRRRPDVQHALNRHSQVTTAVVAIGSGGPSKRRAITAALASGLIDFLVTDVSTAHYLLAAIVTNNRSTGNHHKSPSPVNPKEEELS